MYFSKVLAVFTLAAVAVAIPTSPSGPVVECPQNAKLQCCTQKAAPQGQTALLSALQKVAPGLSLLQLNIIKLLFPLNVDLASGCMLSTK